MIVIQHQNLYPTFEWSRAQTNYLLLYTHLALLLGKVEEFHKMLCKGQALNPWVTQTALNLNQSISLRYSNLRNLRLKPKQAENSCSLPYFKKLTIKDQFFNKAHIPFQTPLEQPLEPPLALIIHKSLLEWIKSKTIIH